MATTPLPPLPLLPLRRADRSGCSWRPGAALRTMRTTHAACAQRPPESFIEEDCDLTTGYQVSLGLLGASDALCWVGYWVERNFRQQLELQLYHDITH